MQMAKSEWEIVQLRQSGLSIKLKKMRRGTWVHGNKESINNQKNLFLIQEATWIIILLLKVLVKHGERFIQNHQSNKSIFIYLFVCYGNAMQEASIHLKGKDKWEVLVWIRMAVIYSRSL